MISIDFTGKDLEVLIASLRDRENVMFNQSLIYKNQSNKEAQFDCLHEWKNTKILRERLENHK